ncbi:DUF6768 family protein [Pararhodobacter zhoushanensis]|uniref:DUF6768 family protein n=1 Tax=Pararhodobacter zhoushanensis TaxID=2479545 RepID=UPI000F8CB1DB|nr:DUF6768 family protein [Pararhodobacter zhoushanensis]
MDNLDRMIAEALADDDTAPVDPGYFALAFSIFGGRTGWTTWVVMVVQVVMFVAAVWAGWHFYTATEAVAALKWGLSAATLAIVATQLKMALMPVMQANRVLLALRRLELRLAQGR